MPGLIFEADLVISTVPIQASLALAALPWRSSTLFFDVLYSPWPTPAAAAVREVGGTVISGLELLLHQAGIRCS